MLLVAAVLAFILPAFQRVDARVDVSIDFFYENLGDGGSWIEAGDYGYCWQPTVAVSNPHWRPYADGYWAYTDQGWTWISYEDFGWATYHYGRWIRLRGRGWVWVPGREWAPAWVSWRAGGDYVGWAPLPPRRAGEYWDESPITARVDIDFDIGPACYNFIEVRYIGEPVLRERIFAADQNAAFITRTVNVTNITYNNSAVYSYGPDYATVSRYSARPIQRLRLQRDTNLDAATAAQSRGLMKVQGDKLVVAAPQQLQKPAKRIAPKVVKEKLAQAPVERGWEPAGDQKAQAELREKMKKEDPKAVPPPTRTSDKVGSSPGATASPAATIAPMTPATSASASAPATTPAKNRSKRNEKVPPAPAPRIAPPPSQEEKPNKPAPDSVKPDAAIEKPKHESPADLAPKIKREPRQERIAPMPPARDEGKKQKKSEPATSPSP